MKVVSTIAMEHSPVLVVINSSEEQEYAALIASSLGYSAPQVVQGTPEDAALVISQQNQTPGYIVLFIGNRGMDVLPEIDALAEQCESHTRVAAVGHVNDIAFYRAIRERGIVEYFNYPPPIDDLRDVLLRSVTGDSAVRGEVISVMAASSGDGSSMVALNTAYLLAKTYRKRVVLVDLDYQFGMVARQLELQPSYGIKEIFDHPERGVDATLIDRMVVHYKNGLDIITAPQSLHFVPPIQPELMRQFVNHLSSSYDYVILDIPHRWNHWVSTTISMSDRLVVVAQMLLKSITHCSRLLNTWTDLGFTSRPLSVVVNRNGSRFKEALHPKDFERIIGRNIDYYIPNDIKIISQSESKGLPVAEMGKSQLLNELERIARGLSEKQSAKGKEG